MNRKGIFYKSFIGFFVIALLFANTGLVREKENAARIAQENRKISAFPKNSFKQKSFYNNFEKWYQDRIRYRSQAIKSWRIFNYKVFGVFLWEDIFQGKNEWLFSRGNVIKEFKEREKKAKALQQIQKYCTDRGVNFVFLLAPPKEAIYMDYFPQRERSKYKAYEYWENQAIDILNKNSVNYLSVSKQFSEARVNSSQPLYFNDDHHWSYYGAAIASDLLLQCFSSADQKQWYQSLPLNETKKDVPKEHSYSSKVGFGQTYKIACPWSSHFTDEIYSVDCYSGKEEKLKVISSNNVLWGKIVQGEGIIKNKKIKNGKTLLILGDSYSSYMVPYLSQYVSTVVSTHYRDCKGKKKDVDLKTLIAKYKPDYVMLEILGNVFYASSDKNKIGKIELK